MEIALVILSVLMHLYLISKWFIPYSMYMGQKMHYATLEHNKQMEIISKDYLNYLIKENK